MTIQSFIAEYQQRVNDCLRLQLDRRAVGATRLRQAMEYSLFANGKRVRPLLVYAGAAAVNGQDLQQEAVDAAACALECIHTYSLIHDDLPAMDDDDLRRGLPTCHIAFDEATAILAGDALQALAFEIIAAIDTISPKAVLRLQSCLAQASGAGGMVAGQALDLEATDNDISRDQLQQIHRLKTGALIKASVLMGAVATESASQQQLQALESYANNVGLAFQVQDDILDVTGNTHDLGKSQGADQRLNKATYVSILGLEQARQQADELLATALAALEVFADSAEPLRQLARYIVARDR